jgi:cytochrome c
MVRIHAFAGTVVLSVLLAACSGGGSEASKPAETAQAPAAAPAAVPVAAAPAAAPVAPAAAPAAPAGPPAATDIATLDGTTLASFTGNPAAGKGVFAQCRTCHVTDPGVNKTGPSLAGIVGRHSGTIAGFAYSAGNANSGITWTKEKLFQYLEKPQRVVPGTKMIFTGLSDPQKRADVIAYLENPS